MSFPIKNINAIYNDQQRLDNEEAERALLKFSQILRKNFIGSITFDTRDYKLFLDNNVFEETIGGCPFRIIFIIHQDRCINLGTDLQAAAHMIIRGIKKIDNNNMRNEISEIN